MPLSAVLTAEDTGRFLSELRQASRPAASEWRHHTKTGRLLEVEVAAHDINYGGRRAELAVIMDITGRRQLEGQLRQAQKMEALGMLTGGVAHDFNNLLTIITGYSQLILAKLSEHDPNRHSAEQIVKAAERAGELTSRLLAFSRRRMLQPKVLDLNAIITSLSTMVQRLIGEDIELQLDLAADLGSVHADSGQIEQVLLNLAANGRDAMPHGGTLTIQTSNQEVTAKSGVTAKPGPYILLAVRDTGTGMDEATRAQAFEPFFTTKKPGAGTGLGLYTVFGIAKQSGGSVTAASEPGHGAAFGVYLPRVDRATVAEPAIPAVPGGRGAETILLVEDDDMLRSLVRETMEAAGYRILEASDPLEARIVADNYQEPIQLLITDVVMPKASGPELAKSLTRHRPALKVLYMSGHAESALLRRGVRRKEAAFLPKPFTPAALAAKVREVLENGDKARHALEN